MNPQNLEDVGLLKSTIDAFPAAVFVVDKDMCIVAANKVGIELTGKDSDKILRKRGGDVIHCLEAINSPDGCGTGPLCDDCVIKDSILDAIDGARVVRSRGRFDIVINGKNEETHILVTASPFEHEGAVYALLILEDVSELIQLKKILPICMSCKKIRNDQEYWDNVDSYFEKYLDLSFSHGLCPQCMDQLYPEFSQGDGDE